MASNGSLSYSDFREAALWMWSTSENLGDTWQMATPCSDVYLTRKTFKKVAVSAVKKRASKADQLRFLRLTNECTIDDKSDVECLAVSEESDAGCLSMLESCICQTDHHIVYSHSYGVPVMYFNVYKPGGELLSLDEIWRCARNEMYSEDVIDVWSFITQQEHPYLHRPFFFLHPCHTADFMAQVKHHIQSSREYLLSWLSVVSPAVQLDLSLQYAVRLKNKIEMQKNIESEVQDIQEEKIT